MSRRKPAAAPAAFDPARTARYNALFAERVERMPAGDRDAFALGYASAVLSAAAAGQPLTAEDRAAAGAIVETFGLHWPPDATRDDRALARRGSQRARPIDPATVDAFASVIANAERETRSAVALGLLGPALHRMTDGKLATRSDRSIAAAVTEHFDLPRVLRS